MKNPNRFGNPKRTHIEETIIRLIRLSRDDRERVHWAARVYGLSLAKFIRQAALNAADDLEDFEQTVRRP
jgi:uncharacterized protein (DUF1778 family)